jgi:hypothetical protein
MKYRIQLQTQRSFVAVFISTLSHQHISKLTYTAFTK